MSRKKFYAVRKGHSTGIYTEWFGPNGAQVQVKGFPGAQYRGFATRDEAEAFMGGDLPMEAPSPSETGPSSERGSEIVVYTDGGAIGNPGPGGYGVVILHPANERREFSGGYRRTTNNRMELMACIIALENLQGSLPVILYSDSRYLVDAVNKKWVFAWQRRNWCKADGKPAKNQDLWERLLKLLENRQVTFRWVKGHAGQEWNERCDQLAGHAMNRPDLPIDRHYEVNCAQEEK